LKHPPVIGTTAAPTPPMAKAARLGERVRLSAFDDGLQDAGRQIAEAFVRGARLNQTAGQFRLCAHIRPLLVRASTTALGQCEKKRLIDAATGFSARQKSKPAGFVAGGLFQLNCFEFRTRPVDSR
jgi:hypothetical protein